jgi:hypothetical protein
LNSNRRKISLITAEGRICEKIRLHISLADYGKLLKISQQPDIVWPNPFLLPMLSVKRDMFPSSTEKGDESIFLEAG